MKSSTSPKTLAELESRLRRDLAILNYPPKNWVARRDETHAGETADVVVAGGGMCGLSAAFALMRLGITNVRVLDRNDAGMEGPWLTYARMRTLRSPKHLTGPIFGLASLSFRAWYEAQWGESAWEALGRIPRPMWAEYLHWYRKVLQIPVENRVRLRRVEYDSNRLRLHIESDDVIRDLPARKVVLATGREGIAAPRVPEALAALPGACCHHSSEDIDFPSMRGRRIAVVGLGASAFDNAAEALEAGATAVHLLGRATAMPRINKAKGLVYAGFTEGFPGLSDEERLRILSYIFQCRVAAPRDSVLRVSQHPNFKLHLGSELRRATRVDGRIELAIGENTLHVDRIIYASGFRIDMGAAPEIAHFANEILTFRDEIEERSPERIDEFLDFPMLGAELEFQERSSGSAPYLKNIHCFNFAAAASHGMISGDIPAVGDGAERLARGIARDLFLDDRHLHERALHAFTEPELLGDELDLDEWWPPLD